MPLGPLLLAAVASSSFTVFGPSGGPYVITPPNEVIEQINLQHLAQLRRLHEDGLAIQRGDGGSLTAAHHAELQARLDRVQETYRRNIERVDPWAVKSDGIRRAR
jgi:hypothetical protein